MDCVLDARTRRRTWWKVGTIPARQHLTSKLNEIEYCYERQSNFPDGIFNAEVKHAPEGTGIVKALLVPRFPVLALGSRVYCSTGWMPMLL
jgi:hypothetical protein